MKIVRLPFLVSIFGHPRFIFDLSRIVFIKTSTPDPHGYKGNMAPIGLRPEVIAELRKLIETSCKERQSDLPCAEVVIVGDGSRHTLNLFEFSVSPTTENEPRDLEEIEEKTIQDSDDYVYWLASCSKLVTAIACMQLVERGQLDLDDADQLPSLCPELSKIKVIGKNGDFESQMRPITLRMLLTHRGTSSCNSKSACNINQMMIPN